MDEVMYNDAVDETGNVYTASLINPDDECKEQYFYESRRTEKCEIDEIKGVTDELLKVRGTTPGKKGQCVTREIYENPNRFNQQITRNEKLEKAKEIIDDLDGDVVAYSEHRLNFMHKDNRNGFSDMFSCREADIRSRAAHNV